MTATLDPSRTGDLRFLKDHNRATVLELVRRKPGLAHAEVTAQRHVTKLTVGALVQQLLAEGSRPQGAVGRPGRALHLNEVRPVVPGAEVSVRGLRVVACSVAGTVLYQQEAAALSTAVDCAALRLAELRQPELANRTFLGLGVSGPVSQPDHRVLFAPNLGWRNMAFLGALEARLQALPGWRLPENEANAAAFGEAYLLRERDPALLAGSPTQPLLRGAQNCAGEIGHTLTLPGGLPCHGGHRGGAETVLSGWAIRATLGVPAGVSLHRAVIARIDERGVQVTLRRAGEALGLLLTHLHHTLNPSDIAIGGGLSRRPGPLIPAALEFFAAHQRSGPASHNRGLRRAHRSARAQRRSADPGAVAPVAAGGPVNRLPATVAG